ncbi:MAG: Holliday junction branch migration protein RuvA [Alphaproteobacteria bacterium]
MIAKLRGLLDSVDDGSAVIDVGGVGYRVTCSRRTLAALPAVGEMVVLHVETIMREDAIQLYGFADQLERAWFTLLTTVQGVGARVALAILSAVDPDEIGSALALQDSATFTRASGVGPKLATRIVTELKGKAPAMVMAAPVGAGRTVAPAGGAAADALSALVNLGYRAPEAQMALAAAAGRLGAGARFDDLVREGLRELAAGRTGGI